MTKNANFDENDVLDMMDLTPPFLICTDSYKSGHFLQYPKARKMLAYGEYRKSMFADDSRILAAGMRYALEKILNRRITYKDIEEADVWYATHGIANTEFYYPREAWISVVENNNGRIPLDIFSVPDGSVIHPHVPVYTIEANDEYSGLVTWFETVLSQIWSPTTTATKSAHFRSFLKPLFDKTADADHHFLLNSRLHDFGFRGISSIESAMVTGAGHLLCFDGTDTQPAGWLATKFNEGRPIGQSVLATEHSVMLSWDTELEAVVNLLNKAKNGAIVSFVADTRDYDAFLDHILPAVADVVKSKNQTFVIRPDSGDPVRCVISGLRKAAKYFGSYLNSRGYRVINNCAVLQGDGINLLTAISIADFVVHEGFSIENVCFGMGGGLLQKQDRDTLSFATKLCGIIYADGRKRNCMKVPKEDLSKFSMPGRLHVVEEGDELKVYPIALDAETPENDFLKQIWCSNYKNIDIAKFRKNAGGTFDEMRARYNDQWFRRSKIAQPLSDSMLSFIEKQIEFERR